MNFRLTTQRVEERKALSLIELRGYKLIKRIEQENITKFEVKLPKRKKAVVWCISNVRVVGVAYIRKLKKQVDDTGVDKGIIVANTRYTWAARREAKKFSIELIPRRFPPFNIFKHALVPKHEILSSEKVKRLLEKYHIKPYQLPRIKASDVAVIAIGAKPGDVVKIIRQSPTAGKHIAHRLVVTDPKAKIKL